MMERMTTYARVALESSRSYYGERAETGRSLQMRRQNERSERADVRF